MADTVKKTDADAVQPLRECVRLSCDFCPTEQAPSAIEAFRLNGRDEGRATEQEGCTHSLRRVMYHYLS